MPETGLPGGYQVISADEAETRYGPFADVAYQFTDYADEQYIRPYEGGLHVPRDLGVQDWTDDDLCPFNVIIDGDLTVEGTLDHYCFEGTGYFHLVTGSLRARNLILTGFPDLVVRGDLTVAGAIMGFRGDDGGYLFVEGDTSAQIVISSQYFNMTFGRQPRAVVVADPHRTSCRVDFTDQELPGMLLPELLDEDGLVDEEKLAEALAAGQRVLRADAPPSRPAVRD